MSPLGLDLRGLWALLLGVANCSFPLALTMIRMRGCDSATVIGLSAFAQGTGYLLSIPGAPSWLALFTSTLAAGNAPLAFKALLMVPQLVAGVLAGRDRQIG